MARRFQLSAGWICRRRDDADRIPAVWDLVYALNGLLQLVSKFCLLFLLYTNFFSIMRLTIFFS